MATKYTVKKGDTLPKLAVKYNTTVANLAKWNDIDNIHLIYIGQALYVTDPGEIPTTKASTTSMVTVKHFGLQADTDRTVFITWEWTKSNTDHYQVIWQYYTSNGVWFIGDESTTTAKQSTYNAPNNALAVRVKVRPVSETHKVNDKDVSYWTGSFTRNCEYKFSNNPPVTPSIPSVELKDLKLTAKLNNIDLGTTYIRFQVVRDDKYTFKDASVRVVKNAVTFSCSVTAGSSYKVRCMAIKPYIKSIINISPLSGLNSDWSEYSDNYGTPPRAPYGITTIKATTETTVKLTWSAIPTATSYDIEYTNNKKYFDTSSDVSKATVEGTTAMITGLETGTEYFFRIRSVNDNGASAWTKVRSVIVGKKPAAPTTWSSSTTVVVGGTLTLYWNHNSVDGSSQTSSELEFIVNDVKTTYKISKNGSYRINADGTLETISLYPEDDKDKTTSCEVVISGYTEGAKIQWRVRTAGITATYGDWSVQRTIDIYAPPTLELGLTDKDGNTLETLTIFPFYITGIAGPSTQKVIGYQLSVIANESYETIDQIGDTKIIKEGDEVYSMYFNTNEDLFVEMSAGNIDLENNIAYTASCSVSMDSGLNANSSIPFIVSWTDVSYEPNAEIAFDDDNVSATIRPYCLDENENPIEDVTLSVYRREFDGSFVTLMEDIENTSDTWITDPHPALDYARYRIVAKTKSTGAISYYDMPGYPIGENSVIIQWDEEWSSYNDVTEDANVEPDWSGSMIKLPYNIDVSESNSSDVSLVPYIGRKHPVSYYGTQVGTTTTWNVAIKKDDEETIYALRRLAVWMGNVYVREPSGLGFWANIKVSFSQRHGDLIIPVSLDITRVEGGA